MYLQVFINKFCISFTCRLTLYFMYLQVNIRFFLYVMYLQANLVQFWLTVNVEIFAQYIFSRISRRAIGARKFDVSENYNHNRTNRI